MYLKKVELSIENENDNTSKKRSALEAPEKNADDSSTSSECSTTSPKKKSTIEKERR